MELVSDNLELGADLLPNCLEFLQSSLDLAPYRVVGYWFSVVPGCFQLKLLVGCLDLVQGCLELVRSCPRLVLIGPDLVPYTPQRLLVARLSWI